MKAVSLLFAAGLMMPLSVLADCSFHPESYEAGDEWQARLAAGSYDEVEEHFSQAQRDFDEGRIDEFQLKAELAPFEGSAQQSDDPYDSWVAKFPKSYVAHLARGTHLIEVADARRGCAYSNLTSSEQFAGYNHYLALARNDLDASLALDQKPFFSYVKLLSRRRFSLAEVSLAMAVLRTVIAEFSGEAAPGSLHQATMFMLAVDIVPKSYFARRALMDTLETRWGGSTDELQAIYDEAALKGLPQVQLAALGSLVFRDDGWVAEEEGDHAAAAEYYKKSIDAIDPKNRSLTGFYVDELTQIGWAEEQLRNFPEAVAWLEKVNAISPSDRWVIYNLAFSLQKEGDLPRAAVLYRQGAELQDPNSLNEWGKCQWWGLGVPIDRSGAIASFEEASDLGVAEAKQNLYWSKKQVAENVFYPQPK